MKKNREITIYDLARTLNISPATVSRGLNGHPAVSKKTKTRIFKLASQMDYRSNTFASNLRRQNTRTIGVIIPKLNSFFMSAVIAGIEKVANQAGYNLIISQSLETVKKESANAQTMYRSRVDGMLVSLAYDTENLAHFEPFFKRGIPVYFFDRVMDHESSTSIIIDNFKAGYEATAHLIGQGCKRIVHVTANHKRNVYTDRLAGYRKALEDHGIGEESILIIEKDLSEQAGISAANRIMQMSPKPDGIFLVNDSWAAHCMITLRQAGYRIPENIAVVGFNNDPISRIVYPALTTVNYPGEEMGTIITRNLINNLKGLEEGKLTNTIIMKSGLIIRDSSQRIK